MVGVLLGSYIFGEASDRFGRKPTFIASVIIQAAFGSLAGVLPGKGTLIKDVTQIGEGDNIEGGTYF